MIPIYTATLTQLSQRNTCVKSNIFGQIGFQFFVRVKSNIDSKISEISEEIHCAILFTIKKVKRVQKKVCEVYGETAVSEQKTQKWFGRFRSGNFNVKDISRSHWKVDKILQVVEQNRHESC